MSTKCRFLSKRPKGEKSVRYCDIMVEMRRIRRLTALCTPWEPLEPHAKENHRIGSLNPDLIKKFEGVKQHRAGHLPSGELKPRNLKKGLILSSDVKTI